MLYITLWVIESVVLSTAVRVFYICILCFLLPTLFSLLPLLFPLFVLFLSHLDIAQFKEMLLINLWNPEFSKETWGIKQKYNVKDNENNTPQKE